MVGPTAYYYTGGGSGSTNGWTSYTFETASAARPEAKRASAPAQTQKGPHGFTPGTTTLISAYDQTKSGQNLTQGDLKQFKPTHSVNFDNTQSYAGLLAATASHPAERLVVGSHGDDGALLFYRDNGQTERVSTRAYAASQLDACAAQGWLPKELFITGCEGCSEINPDQFKALSAQYPGVTIVVSPTVNTVANDGSDVYGEYYAFKDGQMSRSGYYDIDTGRFGPAGDSRIVSGKGNDSDYAYWRDIYAQEWRADGSA